MIDALRYEAVRIVTIRSSWWITGVTLVLAFVVSALMALAFATASGPSSSVGAAGTASILTQAASLPFVPLFVPALVALVGAFAFGHEYRHGMVRATLTAVPNRWAVLGAKVVVVVAYSAAVAALCLLMGLACAVFVDGATLGGRVPVVMIGYVVYTVMFALFGFAMAGLIRNQGAAIALILVIPYVVENVFSLSLAAAGLEGVSRFLPFDAGKQLVLYLPFGEDVRELLFGIQPLGALGGGAVFAVFVAVLLALTSALFVVRDA